MIKIIISKKINFISSDIAWVSDIIIYHAQPCRSDRNGQARLSDILLPLLGPHGLHQDQQF